jgi:hypothetical protein
VVSSGAVGPSAETPDLSLRIAVIMAFFVTIRLAVVIVVVVVVVVMRVMVMRVIA